MGSRILSLLAVVLVVSMTACSKSNKDAGSISTDGAMNSNVTATSAPVDQAATGGPVPGTHHHREAGTMAEDLPAYQHQR